MGNRQAQRIARIRAYSQRRRITLGFHPKSLTGRVDLMTKGEAKNGGPRRGQGSIDKNRADNWQVRCIDPYGRLR